MAEEAAPVAVSTSWNVERCGGLLPAFEELLEMGVGEVEAAAPRGVDDLAAAARRLQAARGRCLALAHPLRRRSAAAGETRFDLAAAEPEVAARALREVEETIAAAAHLRAPVVVLRGTKIEVDGAQGLGRDLEQAATAGDPARRKEILEKIRDLRDGARTAPIERLCRALWTLTRRHPGLILALAPSSDPFGAPDAREFEWLAGEVGAPPLAYWHSTAVCALREFQGLDGAEAFLGVAGDRCRGVYLSDAAGLVAGLPPGAGTIDWRREKELLPPRAVRVLKLDPRSSTLAVRESLRFFT